MEWDIRDRERFGEEVKKEREKRGYTQEKLAEIVSEYLPSPLPQRRISSIELGAKKRTLQPAVLSALKAVLSLSDEVVELATPRKRRKVCSTDRWISVKEGQYIQISAQSNDLRPYLGEYHFVFHSTVREEDKLIHGKLFISSANDGSCCADMEIIGDTGKVIKRYSGAFFINTYYDTCYFILCGTKMQEVCMLIAPRFKGTLAQNHLIMPLVLTTSAGVTKRPTVHRMIISRTKLHGEPLDLALSQLYLNTDMLYISQSQLDELKSVIDRRLEEDSDCKHYLLAKKYCEEIEANGEREYVYKIEESNFLDLIKTCKSSEIRGLATAVVRRNSMGEYHNKIGKSSQSIVNTILKWMENKD